MSKPNLSSIEKAARAELDPKFAAREVAIANGRRVIRFSAKAIRAGHRGEFKEAGAMLAEAGQLLARIEPSRTGSSRSDLLRRSLGVVDLRRPTLGRDRGASWPMRPPRTQYCLPSSLAEFGGPEGARTPDLHTASVALSQLSYRPATDSLARLGACAHEARGAPQSARARRAA